MAEIRLKPRPAAAAYNPRDRQTQPAAQRMSRIVQLRLAPAQYRAFVKAAGLPLTTWLRTIREFRQLAYSEKGPNDEAPTDINDSALESVRIRTISL